MPIDFVTTNIVVLVDGQPARFGYQNCTQFFTLHTGYVRSCSRTTQIVHLLEGPMWPSWIASCRLNYGPTFVTIHQNVAWNWVVHFVGGDSSSNCGFAIHTIQRKRMMWILRPISSFYSDDIECIFLLGCQRYARPHDVVEENPWDAQNDLSKNGCFFNTIHCLPCPPHYHLQQQCFCQQYIISKGNETTSTSGSYKTTDTGRDGGNFASRCRTESNRVDWHG
jgi:hypothetical protein